MNILQIDSSVLGDNSVSRNLTAAIVADLVAKNPSARVTVRDLDREAPAHLGNHLLPVLGGPKDGLNAAQQAELDITEAYLAEFLAADVLVIGVPQYNFGIPSQLKAWIDRIAQAGRTFRYTENGPEGLAKGKKVIVVSSRGGVRQDGAALDLHEVTVDVVLRFLGITDISFVRAHGLAMGPEAREAGLTTAKTEIAALNDALRAAA
ncbi:MULTISPECIES: NAD(P)H-dependent oxidoreductase [unclassified Cupriavidus]|uniref:FMN-dependent NADH-azoreductase n=1 Tax=unclassified Cupriavidus TaxID=2640874 RepID=UPI001BFFEE86|nr:MULTISPECIES: NAD(P)H-dependent oxidoreductase [unclassified Cupriavidus]MCA3185702.1 NAD(P)H-dependent oxidoreductase [Cupriavidus sp.]MCA3189645.1 NAD(P)H-dependent oxidoreductase [Cupriavidus sp.]MCA3195717.1 NAD(P)H-dependent oxidoreductase [Cupriavidus sp.]MCA3203874.1 NAD(P)H-dependent oxidoreductase [Cupriavidus sp.]MCA3206165.1 NAD(P)H-dependent oxidoreductase [Cupriavidus sp.]